MEGGSDFGFSSRRHHIVENLGDGVDRVVERVVGDRWLGRVSGLVAKEVLSTYAAASSVFLQVG